MHVINLLECVVALYDRRNAYADRTVHCIFIVGLKAATLKTRRHTRSGRSQ